MKNQTFRASWLFAMLLILTSFFTTLHAQVQTAKYISMTSNTNAFYEYLPEGYSSTGTKYPLIVFIHGMGELGAGNSSTLPKVLSNGIPKLAQNGTFPKSFVVNGQTHRFVVLSPQFVAWPQPANISGIIDYAIAHYNVDPSRVYVTGLSMGGGATWQTAGNATYVNRIAAVVPVCGAQSATPSKARVIATNNLPVWALHNQTDPTIQVGTTNTWITYINTAPAPNPLARKTIFPGGGHDAWTQAYNPSYREEGKNVYEWMLQYTTTRLGAPANTPPVAYAGGDVTVTLPTNSVQLTGSGTDANGSIAKYDWSLTSGPSTYTINGAALAAPSVTNLVEGVYVFRLTVTDNSGSTATDEVKVTVNKSTTTTNPPSSTAKYIKVKVYGGSNPYSVSDWNNWNVGTGVSWNATSPALSYSDASASTVKAVISHSGGVSDNGTGYAGGMAPKEVLRHASYSTNASGRTITFTGLSAGKKYDFEFYASRGSNSGNNSVFSLGSLVKSVVTYYNYTSKAYFTGLTPDASGKIVINLSKSSVYTYLNGFMITEGSASTSASVARTAAVAEDNVTTRFEAMPAKTEDRTALKLNTDRTGTFNITVTDMQGNVVKETMITKTQAGLTQSYVSLKGLANGQYIVIATQPDYTEAILVNKF
ncbi:MAG: hypothetical protein EOO05_11825 [Chitinophagaceae bacterium]|nr:MAG: hypothetical protein EOO05_11825 [Chitinophagaceae bacterium]